MKQYVNKQLLVAAIATGASDNLHLGTIMKTHVIESNFDTTDAVTALVIVLEGTIDGVHWYTLGTQTYDSAAITATQMRTVVSDQPTLQVRVDITTLTESGTTTVNVNYGACIG